MVGGQSWYLGTVKPALAAHIHPTRETTIAMVSKAIVVSKTLCAQRAIDPSMFKLP